MRLPSSRLICIDLGCSWTVIGSGMDAIKKKMQAMKVEIESEPNSKTGYNQIDYWQWVFIIFVGGEKPQKQKICDAEMVIAVSWEILRNDFGIDIFKKIVRKKLGHKVFNILI